MADGSQAPEIQAAPHNIEAEQAILGALMVNNDVYDRVSSIIEPHHFFDPLHGRIFETAGRRIAKNALAT
ncbi:MAG: DnaB-like helicase N-terminal domain-containing protein, partial [Paracoccaceae bacterium]|nr:DnaB-like helicase N-terminal domain-containing protein [Paracoccaceae bacterium]